MIPSDQGCLAFIEIQFIILAAWNCDSLSSINFQNFKISKFWKLKKRASFFGFLFWNSFVAWALTTFFYRDVSTTSHASFFTVNIKGLTTIPNARWDYSWSNTHDPCGIAFSFRKNAKNMLWQEFMYTWADGLKNLIFRPTKCRICDHR
jgi:hypothetical protein